MSEPRATEQEAGARSTPPSPDDLRLDAPGVLRVRLGHGANCSSVGSVVDILYASAAIGGAALAAVLAALAREAPVVVGEPPSGGAAGPRARADDGAAPDDAKERAP